MFEADSGEEPVEAPERGIFDADDFDFGDLDLELDAEDEPASEEQPVAAAAPVEAAPPEATPEPEIVERAPEDAEPVRQDAQTAAPPPVEEPASEEQPAAEPAPASEGEGEDGEDLLEETPDFLQETEGEDLWFEQGPPRDFDFDDD